MGTRVWLEVLKEVLAISVAIISGDIHRNMQSARSAQLFSIYIRAAAKLASWNIQVDERLLCKLLIVEQSLDCKGLKGKEFVRWDPSVETVKRRSIVVRYRRRWGAAINSYCYFEGRSVLQLESNSYKDVTTCDAGSNRLLIVRQSFSSSCAVHRLQYGTEDKSTHNEGA